MTRVPALDLPSEPLPPVVPGVRRLAVQLHGGGRNSNALLLRLGARHTAGTATPDAPKPDRWTPYTAYQHDTLRWLEVVATVGAPLLRLEPHVAVTEADLAETRRALPADGRPIVAVHPGATDPRRCYPEERLGAVARTLADRGARVVVLGGPAEHDRVRRVVQGFGADVETVVGGTSLGGLLGTLGRSAHARQRQRAAAPGRRRRHPTVAVFTYANLADVAPLTRTWHRMTVSWDSACAGCGRRVLDGPCDCRQSATWDVPEETVREMAVDLWEQVVAAGRDQRDVTGVPEVGAA